MERVALNPQVVQLLQGMAEKGKKEKHEEQVSLSHKDQDCSKPLHQHQVF